MARKGENIYKRKDGRWEGRYLKPSPDGKKRYGYVYAPTYREAKQRLHQAASQLETVSHTNSADGLTLAEAAHQWEQSLTNRVRDSTRVKYRNIVRHHLLPALGTLPLSALTHNIIDAHATALLSNGGRNGEPLSPRTVSDVMSVLRSILRFAARNGAEIPCDGSSVRIRRPPTSITVLSRQEQEMLCAYLFKYTTPPNAGILLSLYTGLRVGEICGLRWEDINVDEGVLHVRRTVQRIHDPDAAATGPRTRIIVTPPKSASSRRTIPLPEEMVRLLLTMPEPHTGWFLTGQEDRFWEPRTMQSHFRSVLTDAGLPPMNYHTLRHTFATRCVELGFDVKALSELLGHSTVTMTMDRYVHPTMEHKRSYMDRLTELLP